MRRKTEDTVDGIPRRWIGWPITGVIMGLALTGLTACAHKVTLEPIAIVNTRVPVMSLRWSPTGEHLASASADPNIILWTMPVGKLTTTLKGHGSATYDLDWTADATLLAGAVCNDQTGGMHCHNGGVVVWDMNEHKIVKQLSWHMDMLPVSSRMAQKEGKASAIDPHSQPGAEARAVAWSKDGRYLAVGDIAGAVKIWNTASWALIYDATPHWVITDLAWGQTGQLAMSALDDKISIWDVSKKEITQVLKHHKHDVYTVAWHPKLPLLASGSGDKTVAIWDAHRNKVIQTLTGFDASIRGVAWRSDGRFLAAATSYTIASRGGEVWIYDTRTWKRVARGPVRTGAMVRSVAWSPNGELLAASSDDSVIKLWRFTTP